MGRKGFPQSAPIQFPIVPGGCAGAKPKTKNKLMSVKYELAYKAGSYTGKDGQAKPEWVKPVMVMSGKETTFAVVDALLLNPTVAVSIWQDRKVEVRSEVLMNVFPAGEKDPEGMVCRISYVAGRYASGAETKASWATFARIFKSAAGGLYARVETAALNPVAVLQMLRAKEQVGQDVIFAVFIPRDEAAAPAAAAAPAPEDDEIPF